MITDVVGCSGAALDAGTDFAVGDTMAVADDHELRESSLLKVIVKVILYTREIAQFI